MRCFLDENLSPILSARLNSLGHDSICAFDAGKSGKTDVEIRRFAVEQGRVLITLDGDFGDLSRYPVAQTPGVIWLKPTPPITLANIERQLLRAIELLKLRNLSGLLVVIDGDRIRTRSGI